MKNILYIILVLQATAILALHFRLESHMTWLQQLSVNYNYLDSATQVLLKEADVEICFFEDHSIGKCYPDAPNN